MGESEKTDDRHDDLEIKIITLFTEQQKNHQDYVKDQITSLKWISGFIISGIGLLATVVFGTFAYLFGQSYSELDKKMAVVANEIAISYRIDSKVQEELDALIELSVEKTASEVDSMFQSELSVLIDQIRPEIENTINTIFLEYEGEKLKEIINDKLARLESTNIPDVLIPSGTIVAWTKLEIPDGWALCDGRNGTPNLRGRFIQGVANPETLLDTGGSSSHSHSFEIAVQALQDKPYDESDIHGIATETYESSDTFSFDSNNSSNLPPYTKLFYIMKL